MLRSLDRILAMFSVAVAALGGISLLVGAVGILTIMTTAVAERAAEIGLLRAVGATSRQVLALFLGEALLLSLLGGLAGLLLMGALLGALQLALPGLPLAVQPGGCCWHCCWRRWSGCSPASPRRGGRLACSRSRRCTASDQRSRS